MHRQCKGVNKCTILLLLFRCSLSKLSSALVIRAVLTGAARKSVFWPWELFHCWGGLREQHCFTRAGRGTESPPNSDSWPPSHLTSCVWHQSTSSSHLWPSAQILRSKYSIIGDIGYQSESIPWCNVVVYCYFSKHSIYESLFIFWAAFIFSVLFIFLYSFN